MNHHVELALIFRNFCGIRFLWKTLNRSLFSRYCPQNGVNICSETQCTKWKCSETNYTKVWSESPTTHFKTKTRGIYAINDDVSKIMERVTKFLNFYSHHFFKSLNKVNESRYIALFVVSGFIKKSCLIDFANIYLFSISFSEVFANIFS